MIRLRMEQLGSVFGSRVLHLEFVKVTARSSSSTSSMGRVKLMRLKYELTAQKSQAKRQPRLNWIRVMGR